MGDRVQNICTLFYSIIKKRGRVERRSVVERKSGREEKRRLEGWEGERVI
jgi:hypothetical protein